MQPCSREMQMAFQELQNGSHHPINDDFLDQMLSSLPSWPDLDGTSGGGGGHFAPFDESALLASRLRQHQISGGGGSDGGGAAAGKEVGFHQLSQQQQMILSSMGRSQTAGGGGGGEPGLVQLPLTLGSNGAGLVDRSMDDEDTTSFKSPNSTGGGEGLFNGFARSLQQQQQHFINAQGGSQNFGASSAPTGSAGAGGGAPATVAAPRQRVRARRGQATDPHSIAERLRRERIAERMKALQELVPNANKTDKASMLDEIIDYVKFLQLQVKVLSMSRLGGAAAVAPLVADISSEAGRGAGAPAANDSLTVTEQQVAKLMEEDMGSAMQYLQGKGLCLMPISLASAISTATCHPRAGSSSAAAGGGLMSASFLSNPNGDGPSSPSLSVLTVQSAVAGGTDSVKEAASVSKP